MNVLAVAGAIAGATATFLGWVLPILPGIATHSGFSTLGHAVLWGVVVRQTRLRWWVRWMSSVPLAASTAVVPLLSSDLSQALGPSEDLERRFIVGAVGTGIIWVPALFLVLLVFGPPVALAAVASRAGLSRQDCAERTVSIFAAVVSACTLAPAVACWAPGDAPIGMQLSTVGLSAAVVAGVLADRRMRWRAALLADIRANVHPAYTWVVTPRGGHVERVLPTTDVYRARSWTEVVVEAGIDGDILPVAVGPRQSAGMRL